MVNLVNALFGVGALCAPLLAELADRLAGSTLAAYPITAALTAASGLLFLAIPSPPTPKALADAAAAEAAAESAAAPLLGAESGAGSGGGAETAAAAAAAAAAEAAEAANPWQLGGRLTNVLIPVSHC
jgi:hypothetical protein